MAEALLGLQRDAYNVELRHARRMDPTLRDGLDIVAGILEGAVEAEGLQNIDACIKDGT